MFRIGLGYDIHAFSDEAAESISIGGIAIPYSRKLIAHSDGDLVLHALTDALLGAVSEGSIGVHFPPSDNKWKNCSSSMFVEYAYGIVRNKGYKISNVDLTVICEEPKIMPYSKSMRERIANLLEVKINQINVKAVTAEGLGAIGRIEGIAAQVAVLLIKR